MQLVNNSIYPNIFKTVFISVCLIMGSLFWFSGIHEQHVNPDEPMWIALTEFYQYRLNGDWSKFQTQQTASRPGYGSEANMAVDQPQSGKYLMGVILDTFNKNPWKLHDISWVYDDFSKMVIPGDKPPSQLTSHFGEDLVDAMSIIRICMSIIGWLCILLFCWFIFSYIQDTYSTSVIFLICTMNPLLLNYFRKAMTDSPSTFLLLVSGICMWTSLYWIEQKKRSGYLLCMCSGILVALAASVKINGLFLLSFFPWLVLVKLINKKQIDLKIIGTTFTCLVIFYFSFGTTFCFLEPITWNGPLTGVRQLLTARLKQQDRFYLGFRSIKYIEMPSYALYVFFKQFNLFLIPVIFANLCIGFYTLFSKAIKKDVYATQVLLVLLFIYMVNFYYARTGFDRYLIPTVFGLLFVEGVGLAIIFEKVTQYVIQKI